MFLHLADSDPSNLEHFNSKTPLRNTECRGKEKGKPTLTPTPHAFATPRACSNERLDHAPGSLLQGGEMQDAADCTAP